MPAPGLAGREERRAPLERRAVGADSEVQLARPTARRAGAGLAPRPPEVAESGAGERNDANPGARRGLLPMLPYFPSVYRVMAGRLRVLAVGVTGNARRASRGVGRPGRRAPYCPAVRPSGRVGSGRSVVPADSPSGPGSAACGSVLGTVSVCCQCPTLIDFVFRD